MSIEQRQEVMGVNRSQVISTVPDVTALTAEYLQKRNVNGVNEVAANLLRVAQGKNSQPSAREQALKDLKQFWSTEPEVKLYFEYLAKVQEAQLRRERINGLKHVFKEVPKPEVPKQLTPVEVQAQSRRHDPRREHIENHLRVANNPNVDQVLRDRAVRELAKYKGEPEVDKLFARESTPR